MLSDHHFVPFLQPVSNAPEPRVHQPLFPENPKSPLNIYFITIRNNRKVYLLPVTQQKLNLKLEDLKAEALNNWLRSHNQLVWRQINVPKAKPIMTVNNNSGAISSIILSHGHLKGMHKHYQSDMVHLAIPDIFNVYISDDVEVLRSHTRAMYAKAQKEGTQLCPNLYTSLNSVIKGFTVPNHIGKKTQQFNLEEQVLPMIQKLMAMSFFIVASARSGGKYGDKEYQLFLIAVTELGESANNLIHQASNAAVENNFSIFKTAIEDIKRQGPMGIIILIQKINDITNKLEFGIIKYHIIALSTLVAASSAGFLSIRKKISSTEQQAIKSLEASFSIIED